MNSRAEDIFITAAEEATRSCRLWFSRTIFCLRRSDQLIFCHFFRFQWLNALKTLGWACGLMVCVLGNVKPKIKIKCTFECVNYVASAKFGYGFNFFHSSAAMNVYGHPEVGNTNNNYLTHFLSSKLSVQKKKTKKYLGIKPQQHSLDHMAKPNPISIQLGEIRKDSTIFCHFGPSGTAYQTFSHRRWRIFADPRFLLFFRKDLNHGDPFTCDLAPLHPTARRSAVWYDEKFKPQKPGGWRRPSRRAATNKRIEGLKLAKNMWLWFWKKGESWRKT